ncbi:MAG: hypothetical protein Q9181_002610 [Wetmoreana brouardii]
MADEVVIHGDFVQFNASARCSTCQVRNLKCALQQSDHGCLACAGAGRECIFSRPVLVSGPKSKFEWSTLLYRERGHTIGALSTPPPSESYFTASPPPLIRRLAQNRQGSMSQVVSQQPSVPMETKSITPRRTFTRSNSSPETEESRSRSGVDPTGRHQLGQIPSLADQVVLRKGPHNPISYVRAQENLMSPGPRHQPLTTRDPTQHSSGLTSLTSTLAQSSRDIPSSKAEEGTFISRPPFQLGAYANGRSVRSSREDTDLGHTSLGSAGFDHNVFRNEILQSHPHLPDFLLQRLVIEQARRFQRLAQLKTNHGNKQRQSGCPSGSFCNGERNYHRWTESTENTTTRPRSPAHLPYSNDPSGRVADKTIQHRHPGLTEQEDDNVETDDEYLVARYPSGYPIPPYQRFPMEFECPFCFQVKKYSKPSDWVKHVHEDFQPFVCTFENCAEPRSFKRKADWVRHENERHRQLEWWICNVKDCSHKCFRKDNFLQHLVREHKLPEPKARPSHGSATVKQTAGLETTSASNPSSVTKDLQWEKEQFWSDNAALTEEERQERWAAKLKPIELRSGLQTTMAVPNTTTAHAMNDNSDDEVWRLLETCRQGTPKKPEEESCKFCGNVCKSWKRLNGHVAKHMEDIAIPIWRTIMLYNFAPQPTNSRVISQGIADSVINVLPHDHQDESMDVDSDDSPVAGRVLPERCPYPNCDRIFKNQSEYRFSVDRPASAQVLVVHCLSPLHGHSAASWEASIKRSGTQRYEDTTQF